MNTTAMILMIFSMLAIWGGLLMAILHLKNNPDLPIDDIEPH